MILSDIVHLYEAVLRESTKEPTISYLIARHFPLCITGFGEMAAD
jgi:hypothetical protein